MIVYTSSSGFFSLCFFSCFVSVQRLSFLVYWIPALPLAVVRLQNPQDSLVESSFPPNIHKHQLHSSITVDVSRKRLNMLELWLRLDVSKQQSSEEWLVVKQPQRQDASTIKDQHNGPRQMNRGLLFSHHLLQFHNQRWLNKEASWEKQGCWCWEGGRDTGLRSAYRPRPGEPSLADDWFLSTWRKRRRQAGSRQTKQESDKGMVI